jgi:hypothetical protein
MQNSQIAATAAGGSLAAVALVQDFTVAEKCKKHGRGEQVVYGVNSAAPMKAIILLGA